MKPAPIPCILCGPGFPPERTGESLGSTATIFISGLCAFKPSPTPLTVPPVPTPATKISTLPSVSRQISWAVVSTCLAGLAGFSNCCRMMEPGVSSRNDSALAMAPFMPSAPGVNTRWAPSAFNRLRRSILIVSGIVRTNLYPLAAETKASPTPVFPLVGSMMVAPGFSSPFFSASSIIARAMRSFTLPAGLKYSSLPISFAFTPLLALKFENSSNGVLPTRSVNDFATFPIFFYVFKLFLIYATKIGIGLIMIYTINRVYFVFIY